MDLVSNPSHLASEVVEKAHIVAAVWTKELSKKRGQAMGSVRLSWRGVLLLALLTMNSGFLASEDDLIDQLDKPVLKVLGAIAVADFDLLQEQLDSSTLSRLQRTIDCEFEGSEESLMETLRKIQHPVRLRSRLSITEPFQDGDCLYARVSLTGNYSRLDDKNIEPLVENKPVVLWVCFTNESEVYKLRLQYPLHDLVYLAQ